ncbi:MAG: hypothetical protein ACOYN5_14500 [Bacteroidales bacterium]
MSDRAIIALSALIVLFSFKSVFSQCCSTGSPVGASVYVGVLNKNSLRAIAYYRHNFSNTYFEGTSKTTTNNQLESSNYNFSGISLAYGMTKRLTVETDFGYFFNKTQVFKTIDYTEKGSGLSTGGVILKYGALVRPAKQFELTLGAGFRYPFSRDPQMIDNVQLSRDVQPSTNAFAVSGMFFISKGFPQAKMRLFSINRFDHNFADKLDYKYGDILVNSVFVSRLIAKNFLALLQLRSEYRWKDEDTGVKRANSGNLLMILSPQLNYAVASKWNISLMTDIPVFKNYNGKQLTPAYSVAIGLTRDFDLGAASKAKRLTESFSKP